MRDDLTLRLAVTGWRVAWRAGERGERGTGVTVNAAVAVHIRCPSSSLP